MIIKASKVSLAIDFLFPFSIPFFNIAKLFSNFDCIL